MRGLRALFVFALLAGPTAWAQDATSLPWRLGPGPGTVVVLPEVETVQGDVVATGVPSLVFFTMFDASDAAYEWVALAKAWQERHPGVQVLLVDTRTPAEEVRDWVQREGVEVPVIADADDAFEEAFDTNRIPILYLLDEQGVIQDKIMGSSLERFTAFDQVLSWAAEGAWEEVKAQRSDWLTVGQVPSRELPEVPLGQGGPTVVYHTNPFCPPCEQVAERLQEELNAFAVSHPEVTIVILEEDARAGFDLEALRELLESYVELYGREAAPGQLLLMVERGRIPVSEEEAATLPAEGWAPTIKLVTYMSGDANDPNRWWGQVFTPGLMVFDAGGAYRGPAPLWLAYYEASALVASMRELLDNP
jgi:thiol-disulfide isomerase/thioredoxin